MEIDIVNEINEMSDMNENKKQIVKVEGNPHDLFNRSEAAEYLHCCMTTLDRLCIPKTKVRNKTLYKREILNKWIDENTEKSTKKGKK